MYKRISFTHGMINIVQSILIIGAFGLLIFFLGWIIAGTTGGFWALMVWMMAILFIPNVSALSVLKLYHAQKLEYVEVPGLYEMIRQLSCKAEIPHVPSLYYIPSSSMIAFTAGSGENHVVALSDGLLRLLTKQEISAVLAHELAHIKHNDIWLMQVSDVASRVACYLSYAAQLLFILAIPYWVLSDDSFPFVLLIVLASIPLLNTLMQLSLSRTREYSADYEAAIMTGNPKALASALNKINRMEKGLFYQLFNPFRKDDDPSLLRSHPPTQKRIEKLLKMEKEMSLKQRAPETVSFKYPQSIPRVIIRPRRHFSGVYW